MTTKSTPGTWPKFLRRQFNTTTMKNEARIVERAEAVDGIGEESVSQLERRVIAATSKLGHNTPEWSLYTAEECARDAAPDLLAALKALIHTQAAAINGTKAKYVPEVVALYRIAQAAISKAEAR